MCCFIFCFESVLNRPPHPRCQEQIKGLFFLIAKIVIPGNESVKTCLHKIAVAKSVLNEMRGKSRSSAKRSDDSPRSPRPKLLPVESRCQVIYLGGDTSESTSSISLFGMKKNGHSSFVMPLIGS